MVAIRTTALIALACSILAAKTPQQLKADLASIMPAGKKARLVWAQGGTWTQPGNKHLYVVDSDDGIVRKLTTGTVDAYNPQITADGSRVVFGENLSGVIKVVNWDGTGLRTVHGSGFISEYWQDPSSKADWFVNSQGNGGVTRINLDGTKQETLLTNREVSWGNGYIGLSPDGTHLAAWFHLPGDVWRPGTVTVPGGVLTTGNVGGCGLGIDPETNSYDYFQHLACAYHGGHQGIMIENGASVVREVCLTQSILTWASSTAGAMNACHDKEEYQTAKWTNLRDYVTFSMFHTKANPFIVRLSDLKWIHILDDADCAYTNALEVRFYAAGTSPVRPAALHVTGAAVSGSVEWYGVDGRKMRSSTRLTGSSAGVGIVRQSGRPAARLMAGR